MRLIYSFKTAIVGLKAHKVRSFLTMLGIIIGVASVVGMMSLGTEVQNLIVGQVMSLGSNNIFIEPGSFDPKKTSMMESMMEQMEIKTLKMSDAEAIEKLDNVDTVTPVVMGTVRVVYRDVDKKTTFLGMNQNAQKILENKIVSGREMTDADVKSRATVALLGHKIKKDLFGDQDPVGETIRIKNVNFKVIGVAEEVGSQMFLSVDEYIFVPVTTAQKLLLGTDHLNNIIVRIKDEKKLDETLEDIRFLLREKHNIYNPEGDLSKDDFRVTSQVEAAKTLTSVTSIFTLFLSSIGAIALIVGGIGKMNIMLVSVTERTKEIGLRKAVGAREKDILMQFLLEAIIMTVIGGVIGIVLGIIFSFVGGLVLVQVLNVGWKFFISIKAILIGFGVAAITGLAFGIYPARKAAKLNPIEALRYE